MLLVVLLGLYFFCLSHFIPGATCRDGWESHSIGRSGYCPHHGGVRRSPYGILVFFLSIAGGFFITNKLNEKKNKKNNNRNKSETPYGSISEHEGKLRKAGVSEAQIKIETNKYKKIK